MYNDYENVPVGNLVIISTDVDEEINGRYYLRVDTPEHYSLKGDLSGAQGIQGPQGPQGIQGPQGPQGIEGPTGPTGNGISSIEKTATSGLVDTYTITYTNGNTTTFNVSNGNGIDRIEKTDTVGNIDTYTIYFTNGETTTYEVENGDVTKEELQEEVDRLNMVYNALPSTTGEAEEISINGTAEVPFRKIDLKGNTYQYSTTGKNLINDYDLINRYNIASISDNIITTNALNSNYTVFQPRTKTQKIDLVENTKYYVSFDCRLKSGTYSAKLGASIIDGINGTSYSTGDTAISNPNMSSLYQRYSFECISNITTNSILGFSIQVQQGLSNAVFEIKNIMISTSSDTTYEEYTGNQPSPSPDYPQDIQVVSGDNTIKVANGDNTEYEEYPISLGNIELCKIGNYQDKIAKSTGKNLFDKDNANVLNAYVDNTEIGTSAKAKITYIKCQPNTTYTISKDNSGNNNRFGIATTTTTPAINVSTMQYVGDNSASSLTITTNSTAEYLVIQFYHTDETKITQQQVLNSIMINEGTTALPYEPYGKVWYLNKQIGKVVLDGSENWVKVTSTNNKRIFDYSFRTQSSYSDMESINFNYLQQTICDKAIAGQGPARGVAECVKEGIECGGNKVYFAYEEYQNYTAEEFKQWVANNNITIYYKKATPTTTEITDTTLISQLEALKNAYSYDTQTNISQTNQDKPFIISYEAILSLKNILNSLETRIAVLETE